MTICNECGGVGAMHVGGCQTHRRISCKELPGCDGRSHDIRCNDYYFRRKS